MLHETRRRLRRVWRYLRRDRFEADLTDELRFHLEMEAQAHVQSGRAPSEADSLAMASFGDVSEVRLECEDAQGIRAGNELIDDTRTASRALVAARAVLIPAATTLSLSISAMLIVVAFAAAIFIPRSPFPDAAKLTRIHATRTAGDFGLASMSLPDARDIATRLADVMQLGVFVRAELNARIGGHRERIEALRVSENMLALLQVDADVGRTIAATDSASAVALLSRTTATRIFGTPQQSLGDTLLLDGKPHIVIGVIADDVFPERAQLMMPLHAYERTRGDRSLEVIARIQPGFSRRHVASVLSTLGDSLSSSYPETNSGWTFVAQKLGQSDRSRYGTSAILLLGSAIGVLLLALVALRMMIAAIPVPRPSSSVSAVSRGNDLQLLRRTQRRVTLTYVITGAVVLCVALVVWLSLSNTFARRLPSDVSLWAIERARERAPLLLLLCGLGAFAIYWITSGSRAPLVAFGSSDRDGASSRDAESGSMASTGSKRQSLRLLMMASAVVSIVLCLGTAMLGRSVVRLQAVDTGIDARDVQTFRVALPESRSPDEVRAFYRGLLPDIAAFSTDHLSGASAALPTVENDMRYGLIASGDAPTFNDGVGHLSVVQSVTPDYFAALRVHLITGRSISAADTNGAEPAAVVTEPVARALWATTDPVGKHIRLGPGASEVRTVVGVVSGIRQHAIDEEPGWGVYLSHAQFPARAMSVVFRSSASRNDIAALVERAVSSHDSTVVAFALQPMTAVLSASEYPRRLYFAVFLTLAVLSLAVLFAVTYVSAIVAGQDREPRRVTRLAPNKRSLDMSAERLFLAMSVVASVVLAPVVARGLGGALADIGWFDWPSVVLASLSVVVGMTLARQVARRL